MLFVPVGAALLADSRAVSDAPERTTVVAAGNATLPVILRVILKPFYTVGAAAAKMGGGSIFSAPNDFVSLDSSTVGSDDRESLTSAKICKLPCADV